MKPASKHASLSHIDPDDLHNPARGVRLQRVLADLGVGARRACEKAIEDGRVAVNGKVVQKLPIFVDPGNDHIAVDGRPLPKTSKVRRVYVMLHKPERTLTVSSDEPGADRRTVLDLVQHPSAWRLYPVGRLEYDATGLVLLTNDGEVANRLSHPRFGIAKVYHAIVKGNISDQKLGELEQEIFLSERKAARTQTRMKASGVKFKGEVPRQLRTSKPIKGIYRAAHVRLAAIKRAEGKTMVEITLTEGRNRHVDGIFAAHGFPIRKLTQVGLGPLSLTGLALGAWRELEREEIIALMQSVKDSKAAERTGKPMRVRRDPAAGGGKTNRRSDEQFAASRPIPERGPKAEQEPTADETDRRPLRSSAGGRRSGKPERGGRGQGQPASPERQSRPTADSSARSLARPPVQAPVVSEDRPMPQRGLGSNRRPRVIGKK